MSGPRLFQASSAGKRLAERDLVGVLEVGADRKAAGEAGDGHLTAQQVGDVQGGRLAGGGRVGRQHHLADAAALDPPPQLADLQVFGVDTVDRRQRPAEDVVEAAVFVGALDRDHVGRLLDDADHRPVAVVVGADPAERPLDEVEALLAEADLLLHFADRVAEGEGLFVGRTEEGEGEPLRRAPADTRQARELGDEARERCRALAQPPSIPPRSPRSPPATPPIFELASSCAARRPSLTAACTISWSSSASSASIASGSMRISRRVRSPPIFTLTMPPPALASTTSSFSFSCASSMSACICCACFIRPWMSKPPGPPPRATSQPPPRRTRSSAAPAALARQPHRYPAPAWPAVPRRPESRSWVSAPDPQLPRKRRRQHRAAPATRPSSC